jgi:hypothetical protein
MKVFLEAPPWGNSSSTSARLMSRGGSVLRGVGLDSYNWVLGLDPVIIGFKG